MLSITPSLSNLPESITSPIFFTTLKGHLFNTVMAMATGKDENIEVCGNRVDIMDIGWNL